MTENEFLNTMRKIERMHKKAIEENMR